MSDQQFYEALKKYLGADAPVPVFYQDNHAIDRVKTLRLPCYMDFKLTVSLEEK
jgi:hypothetical protein